MVTQIVNLIPNSMIDDFFIFGFVSGLFGYMSYLFINRSKPDMNMNWLVGIYGIILSGCIGGLLAIVFDNSIETSIIVGLLNQFIYMSLLKSAQTGDFWKVLKEILIKFLTGGKGGV